MTTPNSNDKAVQGTTKSKATPASTNTPTEAPAKEKELKPVLEATGRYGIEGHMIPMANVKNGRKLSNKMAGDDPAPGKSKFAIIDYSWNTGDKKGPTKQVTVKENEKIDLPQ